MAATDNVISDDQKRQIIMCAVQADGTVTKILVDSSGKVAVTL